MVTADTIAMMNPHKMDFHQRAVPSPMERMGKCSPRRTITMRASALTQIRDSFRIAEANVVSGTKNAISWRIATIANSEIASPAHVARETFGGTAGWFEANGNGAARLFVSIRSPLRCRPRAVWIRENHPLRSPSCFARARRWPIGRRRACPTTFQDRERRRNRGDCGALGDRALPIGVGSYIRYCTVTSVPTGISEKNLRAVSSGNRMQPCDAG